MRKTLLATAISVISFQAHAAVITVSRNFVATGQASAAGNTDTPFPPFDTSLGTLTSASLLINGFFQPGAFLAGPGPDGLPTSVILTPHVSIFPVLRMRHKITALFSGF